MGGPPRGRNGINRISSEWRLSLQAICTTYSEPLRTVDSGEPISTAVTRKSINRRPFSSLSLVVHVTMGMTFARSSSAQAAFSNAGRHARIAALIVAGMHARELMLREQLVDQSYLAVDFFFCLSGFVVAYAYDGRLSATMRFATFVKVRLIRLYPMIVIGALLNT